jgi:NAD(P)-dependent dehydrogenase (short-subunit alcohol dehydrogenase family)
VRHARAAAEARARRRRLAAATAEARARAPGSLAVPAELADAAAVEAAAARVEKEFGPIDVWVNATMASVFSPIAELAADEVCGSLR